MEAVPFLRDGAGRSPADGGCIMQVVDWVHSGMWTDSPWCVHPKLRVVAISLNDCLDDAHRQRLLPLIPKLMGTAYHLDEKGGSRFVDNDIEIRLHQLGLELSIENISDTREHQDAWLDAFVRYVDRFNEIIGRTPSTKMPDLSGVCAVMQPA